MLLFMPPASNRCYISSQLKLAKQNWEGGQQIKPEKCQTLNISNMKLSSMKIFNITIQAGRMVAEDLELTVETLRCKEDREAGGLVKKVCSYFWLKM